jgi:predicted SnoaL-like aldol condensation-catalyzing enzyme
VSIRKKHKTTAIAKSIETGKRFPLHYIDSRRYVQHNLALGDGLGPLLEYFDQLPDGTSTVDPVRAFEDGDISLAHLEYYLEGYGHVAGFEVHRWEDDRIVEHWDNLQPIPDQPSPSGHTMLDGPTEPDELDRTEHNKRRAEEFVTTILTDRKIDALPEFIDGERYIQHNPKWGDGAAELHRMLATTEGPDAVVYHTLHRVLGEGNFCLTMSEGSAGGEHSALFDLFRLSDGKVVEHWDVVERIPPRAEWKNDNGKF